MISTLCTSVRHAPFNSGRVLMMPLPDYVITPLEKIARNKRHLHRTITRSSPGSSNLSGRGLGPGTWRRARIPVRFRSRLGSCVINTDLETLTRVIVAQLRRKSLAPGSGRVALGLCSSISLHISWCSACTRLVIGRAFMYWARFCVTAGRPQNR